MYHTLAMKRLTTRYWLSSKQLWFHTVKSYSHENVKDTSSSLAKFCRMEDQKEVWEEAMRIGRLMGERLK